MFDCLSYVPLPVLRPLSDKEQNTAHMGWPMRAAAASSCNNANVIEIKSIHSRKGQMAIRDIGRLANISKMTVLNVISDRVIISGWSKRRWDELTVEHSGNGHVPKHGHDNRLCDYPMERQWLIALGQLSKSNSLFAQCKTLCLPLLQWLHCIFQENFEDVSINTFSADCRLSIRAGKPFH